MCCANSTAHPNPRRFPFSPSQYRVVQDDSSGGWYPQVSEDGLRKIMHKTILASASIAALGVSTAMAADLGAMPTKAPNFVAAPSWTGAYVGLNAGYGWGHSDATGLVSEPGRLPLNAPSLTPKGFIGGGQ